MSTPARANGTATRLSGQSPVPDRRRRARSVPVDHLRAEHLALVRRCISERGWTIAAVAAEMELDEGYLWKILHDKPGWTTAHDYALPDDIETLLRARQAEALGTVVAEPVNDADEALRCALRAVVWLFGRRRLPNRTGGQLKASLPENGQ